MLETEHLIVIRNLQLRRAECFQILGEAAKSKCILSFNTSRMVILGKTRWVNGFSMLMNSCKDFYLVLLLSSSRGPLTFVWATHFKTNCRNITKRHYKVILQLDNGRRHVTKVIKAYFETVVSSRRYYIWFFFVQWPGEKCK